VRLVERGLVDDLRPGVARDAGQASAHRERVRAGFDDARPREKERGSVRSDRVAGRDRDRPDAAQENSGLASTAAATRRPSVSAARAARCALAARTKSLKSGWQANGLDLSSGWNWHPRNQGCSSRSSMISTNFRSGDIPENDIPAFCRTGRYSWFTS